MRLYLSFYGHFTFSERGKNREVTFKEHVLYVNKYVNCFIIFYLREPGIDTMYEKAKTLEIMYSLACPLVSIFVLGRSDQQSPWRYRHQPSLGYMFECFQLPGMLPLAFLHVESSPSFQLRHHIFVKFPTWEIWLLLLYKICHVLSFIFRPNTPCSRWQVPSDPIQFSYESHYALLPLTLDFAQSNNSNETEFGLGKIKENFL